MKNDVYMYIYKHTHTYMKQFVLHLKLTQYCKSLIPQYKIH